jgi:RimJ/RimL family protein N-acetyltransferase
MIETRRLRFRPWNEADADTLFKYASDPDVGIRAGWPPHQTVEESLRVIREFFNNDHTWALVLKETGEPIGCMGYLPYGESNIGIGQEDAELGYWIAKPLWNQGLCTEALQAMVDWCFLEKGFQRLWSDFFVDNPASGRVMAKCGFSDTGQTNWLSHLYQGNKKPVKVMRLTREDYRPSQE